jgi:hypothetical protein
MKHVIAVALAFIVLPTPARAQTKPDFSGTWTMDASRSASAVQNEPIRSKSMVIRQTATELTIERTTDGNNQTIRYKPGAPDSKGSSAATAAESIWYWDGSRLVTETVGNISEATVRTKEVLSLDTSGNELTVETLLVVEHGYTLTGAKNYSSGKDVYKRVE